MARLAHVVPLAPVGGVYTYAVPDELDEEATVGARVLVPFGRRQLTGVVVRRDEGDADGAKPLAGALDGRPALTPELLALTEWVAGYYLCTWGEALKSALPSGAEVESRRVARVRAPAAAWPDEVRSRTVLAALADAPDGLPLDAVARALGRATVPHALLQRLADAGALEIVDEVQAARARARIEKHLRLAPGVTPEAAVADLRGARQRDLVWYLAEADGLVRQAEALATAQASSSTVAGLVARGLVEVVDAEVERRTDGLDDAHVPPPDVALHPMQARALDALTDAIATRQPRTFLLEGVTGSGKTEVYLRALRAVRERGQTGLVLVPEIALTPQTVRRFTAHFPGEVAVLHSRMSPGERLDAWTRIRDGVYPIVVGPRSAVWAPVADLGLVVVDEEHEASYKQFDPAPRYHARDVAVLRAHQAGAVCVLGSATPSLESVANARAGKYVHLLMPDRVPVRGREAAPLPTVRIVDLTREREIRRLKGALSLPLREAIQARLDRDEQTILLQNRRGYAPVLTCESCGFTPMCRDCAVSLTVHKTNRTLRCHYCGRAERIPPQCPSCGEHALKLLGAGTQRVEEELASVFPAARVLRMDLDTTSRKGAHRQLLDRFGRGEADLLLGTQMVAKGLDFPRVTLVGVVEADTGMLLPDFRAAERTFSLLAQVAGRAGRHDLEGEVILQTRNPDHPAVRFALAHDVAGFQAHELAERRALGYPPFGRLIGAEVKGPDERTTRELAQRWTTALEREAMKIAGVQVLGPVPAFVGRVQRQWRFHTLLKAPRTVPHAALAEAVRRANAAAPAPSRHRVNVDVDPVGLY